MHVLVSTASKHGSTAEIGEAIASELARLGLTVSTVDPEEVDDIDPYDAFVFGSAVYAGRWQKSARELIARVSSELGDRPVWLFSSGPIGDPPAPEVDPVDVAELMNDTGAAGHRLFAGRLLQSSLSFGERAIVAALRAEYGDFRDWDAIRGWAAEIASTLDSRSASSAIR
jgi:menaquinone-dependent protoporphyrinogen oxidase